MTFEEIEELIDSVTLAADIYGQVSARAKNDISNYYIRERDLENRLRWVLKKRETLKDAITQYGCESASEAFTMGYNAAKSDYEKTGKMEWLPGPQEMPE